MIKSIMSIKPKVVVLVVTYNRKNNLIKCLNGIYNQTSEFDFVYCIDNNSSDGTEDALLEKGYMDKPDFKYYNTGSNLGGAGGFNFGFNVALDNYEFDYIWVMDDDVIPERDCLEKLLMHANENSVMQPCRFYFDDNSFVKSESVFINLNNGFKELKQSYITQVDLSDKELIDIDCFPFEGPLISRKIINRIGLPDPDYFIMADDTDYSIRVKINNFHIKMVTNARLFRQIKPSPSSNLDWKSYFYIRNLIILDKKYGTKSTVFLRTFLRVLRYLISCMYHKRDVKSYHMLYEAVRDSLSGNINNDIKRFFEN